ncbi:MAG: DUF3786 domain-containing protein [Anaerolineales bacterium]|nr:DUF3786 domain-containing protein [Anaerolineales bacterium]
MDQTEQNEQLRVLACRVDSLRAGLCGRDPQQLAALTGATFFEKVFQLSLFRQAVYIPFPTLEAVDAASGASLPTFLQALLLYYFVTAAGIPPAGRWVSFADLPGGRMYSRAYQGYTGNELARRFGADLTGFCRACRSAGGEPFDIGDAAFAFQALPRIALLAVLWSGDDEFPSSCQVLFDPTATDYLPVDVCAILGSQLTRKLLKA